MAKTIKPHAPAQLRTALTGREVQLTIPLKAAYDLKSVQTIVTNLAERLGCPACFSGVDCTFRLEQDLVVLPDLQIEGVLR